MTMLGDRSRDEGNVYNDEHTTEESLSEQVMTVLRATVGALNGGPIKKYAEFAFKELEEEDLNIKVVRKRWIDNSGGLPKWLIEEVGNSLPKFVGEIHEVNGKGWKYEMTPDCRKHVGVIIKESLPEKRSSDFCQQEIPFQVQV